MFTDHLKVELRAGKGGNGVVAWRREKYIPKGGPCGGDGGKGASIFLQADTQIHSLEAYRYRSILKAEDGQQGGAGQCRGRNGKDLVLKVPVGTLVKDESGEVLFDLTQDQEKICLVLGGYGGKGNTHFKSPTNRAPNTCTPGKQGQIKKLELELKLIADVGLVGFPNAGKSSLLSKITHIPVKTAPYPFTTLRPNLGFLIDDTQRLLIADIPGIIADAHTNRGLGLKFLRHIERTSFLLFVIDSSGIEGRDPVEDFITLRREIEYYNPDLLNKPYAVVLNKNDLESSAAFISDFREKFSMKLFEASSLTGSGIDNITSFLKKLLISDTPLLYSA